MKKDITFDEDKQTGELTDREGWNKDKPEHEHGNSIEKDIEDREPEVCEDVTLI